MIKASSHKIFFYSIIGFLAFCAVIDGGLILFGQTSDFTGKALFMTIFIMFYSFACLLTYMTERKRKTRYLTKFSLGVSLVGLIAAAIEVWLPHPTIPQIMGVVVSTAILDIATIHITVLFMMKTKTMWGENIRYGAMLATVVITGLILNSVLLNFYQISELYFKILAVLMIIDVFGTISTVILNFL